MNLSELTLPELKALLEEIPAEIKRREKSEKAKLRKEFEELAAKSGFSLDELFNEAGERVKRERGPVAAKYRHPHQPELEWTGRGRQPRWIAEFVGNGGSLEQLSV